MGRRKSVIVGLMRSCREKEMKFLVRTLVSYAGIACFEVKFVENMILSSCSPLLDDIAFGAQGHLSLSLLGKGKNQIYME